MNLRLKTFLLSAFAFIGLASFNSYSQDLYTNLNKAMEAYKAKDYARALDFAQAALQIDPKNSLAYSINGDIYAYYERYGESLAAYANALEYAGKQKWLKQAVYSSRPKVYLAVGDTLKAMNDYAEALKISKAMKDKDNQYDVYSQRAFVYWNCNEYSAAKSDYLSMLDLRPGDAYALLCLGSIELGNGNLDLALKLIDGSLLSDPDYSNAYAARSKIYFFKNDYDRASDDLVKALSIDYNDRAFYELFNFEGAAMYQLIAKLKVQAAKDKSNYYWPYTVGVVYEHAGKFPMAIEWYTKSARLEPRPVTYCRLAAAYDDYGDYQRAVEAIDKAISLDSEKEKYLAFKAEYLAHSGDLKTAIALLDKFLEEKPDSWYRYYRRGWFKDNAGDKEGAMEDYNMCVSLKPDYDYVYMNMGKILLYEGYKDDGIACMEKVLSLNSADNPSEAVPYAYFYLNEYSKAKDAMSKLLEKDRKAHLYDAACLYSLLDDKMRALDYFKGALESGYRQFAHMEIDTDLDNIRNTPEFKDLVKEYRAKAEADFHTLDDDAEYEETVSEVPFVKDGDMCMVKCTVNDLPLHFILDTGASSVSISSVEANFMLKNGYLSTKDFIGRQSYLNANGEIAEGAVINLRHIVFAGLELDNVRASVMYNQSAPLLLGQSVLERLGKIEIDNAGRKLKITYMRRK